MRRLRPGRLARRQCNAFSPRPAYCWASPGPTVGAVEPGHRAVGLAVSARASPGASSFPPKKPGCALPQRRRCGRAWPAPAIGPEARSSPPVAPVAPVAPVVPTTLAPSPSLALRVKPGCYARAWRTGGTAPAGLSRAQATRPRGHRPDCAAFYLALGAQLLFDFLFVRSWPELYCCRCWGWRRSWSWCWPGLPWRYPRC